MRGTVALDERRWDGLGAEIEIPTSRDIVQLRWSTRVGLMHALCQKHYQYLAQQTFNGEISRWIGLDRIFVVYHYANVMYEPNSIVIIPILTRIPASQRASYTPE